MSAKELIERVVNGEDARSVISEARGKRYSDYTPADKAAAALDGILQDASEKISSAARKLFKADKEGVYKTGGKLSLDASKAIDKAAKGNFFIAEK